LLKFSLRCSEAKSIALTLFGRLPDIILEKQFGEEVKTMNIIVQLRDSVNVIREFVAPSYRPERHYMRGPGPACAARTVN